MKQVFFGLFIFSCFLSLVVYPAAVFANTPPVANPGGPYEGVTGKAILFNSSASSDADDDFLSYSWNFGDGSTGAGVFPSHAYAAVGVYTVTLQVSDGVAADTKTTTATISLRPPAIPNPQSGAPFVSLPLVLDWENVPVAQSYRYELIGYQEDGEPKEFLVIQSQSDTLSPAVLKFLEPQHESQWYRDKCMHFDKDGDGKAKNADGTPNECTATEVQMFLQQEQKRLWHVKSCEDTAGTICGPWGEVWDFTYLLGPPKILAPTSGNTNLPVYFDWEEVVGAESYLFRGEIDFSSPSWQNVLGFISDRSGWFARLAVDFVMDRLGVAKEAIRCPFALWDENVTGEDEIPCVDVTVNRNPETNVLTTEYVDSDCTFTKETKYKWYIATCLGPSAQHCGKFSEKESFETSNTYKGVPGFIIPAPDLTAPVYNPSKPEEIPVVGFNDVLSWNTEGDGSNCVHFHKVVLTRETEGTPIEAVDMGNFSLAFDTKQWTDGSKDSPQEKIWRSLDAVYAWTAEPCLVNTKQRGDIDCDEGGPSETWKFKTTGAIPLHPQSEITNKVKLLWDAVKGAGSYKYQVATSNAFSPIIKEGIMLEPKITLSHPDILPQTNYWWRAASCADSTGVICGQWTLPQQLTTLPMNPPQAPVHPTNRGQAFLPGSLSWQPDPGSSYYQYQASYLALAPDETLEGCEEKVGTQLIQPFPITQQISFFLDEKCAGEYRWAVRSCADKTCVLATDWPRQPWVFTGMETPVKESGLVPCGRNTNILATPYNEKEPCQLKHVGFLLQNILDFVLWKVSLFVLLLLAVITGVTSYFSLGGKDTLKNMRTVFRSFFVGFLVLMFAWMFVNIILMLFGFKFEFFGKWWELSF